MSAMNTIIDPAATPEATTKHTLCGYAWGDVSSAFARAIGAGDATRAQRWAAELVCSESGLGRLEALFLTTWASNINTAYPAAATYLHTTIASLREAWAKAGGDTRAIRNTPSVRTTVAEMCGMLLCAPKTPLPDLPSPADVYKEAEIVRARVRTGGGSGDQLATRKIFVSGVDSTDLRTIGNEFEASFRSRNRVALLFWIAWWFTLDASAESPPCKERGVTHLPTKQRKSILWLLVAILKELANESQFLSVPDRGRVFELLELTWMKLGAKGRREILTALTLCIQESFFKKNTLRLSDAAVIGPDAIRSAAIGIDSIYTSIAEEARRYIAERPHIAYLTPESVVQNKLLRSRDGKTDPKKSVVTAEQKMALAFSLAR